jgi:hypothetical protein
MTTSDRKPTHPATQPSRANVNVAADDPGGLFIDQGSPILIGGGSVNINFREDLGHYEPVVGQPGKFVKVNDEIDTILIVNAKHVLMNNLLSVVRGRDCQVTIHTNLGGAAPSDIVISSRPGGNIELSFNAAEFVQDMADPDLKHFNQNRKLVEMVDVLDRASGQTVRFAIPPLGIGLIQIINSN